MTYQEWLKLDPAVQRMDKEGQVNSVIGQFRYGHITYADARAVLGEIDKNPSTVVDKAHGDSLNDAKREREADVQGAINNNTIANLDPRYSKDFLTSMGVTPDEAAKVTKTDTSAPFSTPDLDAFRDTINKNLVPPEDIATLSAKYAGSVEKAFKPGEEEVQQQLKEEFNASSPWSYGSGGQLKATRDLLIKQSANRMATQLSLGTTEYQVKSDMYKTAVGAQGQLAGITSNAELQRQQNEWNTEQARLTAAREEASAIKIADMYQPAEKPWWQYILEPVATGVGYAVGGPVGAGAVKGITNWLKG